MTLAGLVHGALGLGFPMVATPIIAIFFDVRVAIVFTLLPTVVVNLATIFEGHATLSELRKFTVLIGCSLIGAMIGALLMTMMDPNPFRLILALLIFLFLFSNRISRIPTNYLQRFPTLLMVFFGLLAGASGGITNVMVAILLIYLLSLELETARMIAVLNSCFLVGKLTQITVFASTGLISWYSMLQTLPLAVIAIVALLIGQRIQPYISVDHYKLILRGLLLLLALILIVQFFNSLP